MRPPLKLDGALVIHYALAARDFGLVSEADGSSRAIKALAICQYEGAEGQAYLFSCAEDWEVIGDLVCESVGQAKAEAGRYYGIGPLKWMGVG